MTRPTKIGYAPKHARYYAGPGVSVPIGYDPDVPTGSVPDPTDYADDAGWFYPFDASGTPAYVQHKRGTHASGVVTITLDDAPTPGNILVMLVPLRESIGVTPVLSGSGWTLVRSEYTGSEAGNWPFFMWWRPVEVGDGSVWTATNPAAATNIAAWLVELSGVTALDEDVGSSNATGEGTISITPVTPNPVIVLSAVSVRDDATNIDYTPVAGMTEIIDDQLTPSVAGPNFGVNYRVIAAPSGAYTVGSTLSYTGSQRAIIAASFTADGEVLWFVAFAANDDDDNSFDVVLASAVAAADGVFLRGTLPVAVILREATLRLALEDAGSTTIAIEGANASDFSDAVALDTVTFTATGSFIPQTITFDLPATDGYTFLRFVLTSAAQDVWPHEVTLTAPTDSDTHSHVHDHDDDYLTVRYGGGDVLSTVLDIGAAETIDLANGNVFQLTLNADCTFTFTGADAGRARSFRLYLWQDEVGGWDVTWPASVEWAGGEPILDDDPETLSVFMFETLDGGTVWHGYAVGGGAVDSTLRWEAVTNGEDVFVWEDDDLVHEWKEYA